MSLFSLYMRAFALSFCVFFFDVFSCHLESYTFLKRKWRGRGSGGEGILRGAERSWGKGNCHWDVFILN